MANIIERANSDQYIIYDFDIEYLTLSVTHLGGKKNTNGHKHQWGEAYYFAEGSGYVEIEDRVVEVSVGSFIEINPNEFHRVFNCTDSILTFICSWVNNA